MLLLGWPGIMGGDKEEGRILLATLIQWDKEAAYLVEATALAEDQESLERKEELLLLAVQASGNSVRQAALVRLGQFYVDNNQYQQAIPILKQSLDIPRTWLGDIDAYKAPMFLAAAYYFLEDDINFKKYALMAENVSSLPRNQKSFEGWFKDLDVEYEFSTF